MHATPSKRRQARALRHKRTCRHSLATSDGLRTFDYDEANRISKARIFKDGEAARISYLHNAQGQRVFKGEPTAEQTLPNEATLGQGFIDWLKANFKWMFAQAQANTSIGTAYTFGGGPIPSWAILGEYDNGAAKGAGRSEYIWLPTNDGSAIPVGMFRNGNFFAIHTDHLGSPRLMTNEDNKPVWQWPYSAFGTTKPTGILKATANPRTAITLIDNTPQDRPKQRAQAAAPMNSNIVLLQATAAPEMNLRFPGQYEDAETGSFYNYFRSYQPGQGRYTQNDPIGLEGGLNRFAYANGAPLTFIDPEGLMGGRGPGGGARKPAPVVNAFGCMGLACVTGGMEPASMSAELTFGGGAEICDAPQPKPEPQTCTKSDPNVQVQWPGIPAPEGGSSKLTMRGGLFIGPSMKRDGRICVRFGPHYTVPFSPSLDLGSMR